MSEKILFIGGPLDGQRKIQPNQLTRQIHSFTGCDPSRCVVDHSYGVTTATYEIKLLQENGKCFEVAMYSGITNPLERLIKGYHYHRRPRSRYTGRKQPWPGIPFIHSSQP